MTASVSDNLDRRPVACKPLRILVVAPFTHQNGHFVTFPRDISCALHANGHKVTLVHTRQFRTELDWFGTSFKRICLRDLLEGSPWWWKEFWMRFANFPSALCLAWIVWKLRPQDYDLALWTDFQAQQNVWPLTISRFLGFYRLRTAFVEHHPPDEVNRLSALLHRRLTADRIRLSKLHMFVFSKDLSNLWAARLGRDKTPSYVPWGVWPKTAADSRRTSSRIALGIDEHARVLLIFGVQAVKRKHIDTLYEVVSSYSAAKPLTLLFVGASFDREPHPFSGWSQNNVDVRMAEGFIPEEKVDDYFYAADAIWANYRDFPGASGALLQAVGYGRLTIASGEGEIGAISREHDLGIIVEAADTDSLKLALGIFVSMPREKQAAWEQHVRSIGTQYAWPQIAQEIMASLDFDHTSDHPPAN